MGRGARVINKNLLPSSDVMFDSSVITAFHSIPAILRYKPASASHNRPTSPP